MEAPKNCLSFKDHKCIVRGDIDNNRPSDQTNISSERVIRHGFGIKTRGGGLFSKPLYVVYSTTTYEMAGDYRHTYMGGRCWAETDDTGLEWVFATKKEAEEWMKECCRITLDSNSEIV
jgi:hypothetical protein